MGDMFSHIMKSVKSTQYLLCPQDFLKLVQQYWHRKAFRNAKCHCICTSGNLLGVKIAKWRGLEEETWGCSRLHPLLPCCVAPQAPFLLPAPHATDLPRPHPRLHNLFFPGKAKPWKPSRWGWSLGSTEAAPQSCRVPWALLPAPFTPEHRSTAARSQSPSAGTRHVPRALLSWGCFSKRASCDWEAKLGAANPSPEAEVSGSHLSPLREAEIPAGQLATTLLSVKSEETQS